MHYIIDDLSLLKTRSTTSVHVQVSICLYVDDQENTYLHILNFNFNSISKLNLFTVNIQNALKPVLLVINDCIFVLIKFLMTTNS